MQIRETNIALTDAAIKSVKSLKNLVKLSDGGGLQLWIFPQGGKRWRFAYRFDNKQKTLALGTYPGLSLKGERQGRESAKELLS